MDVKVDVFDLDVGEEGILVERDRVSSIVCHVEPIREKLVVNILHCLLQGDDVPFLCTGERLGTLLSKIQKPSFTHSKTISCE